MKKFQRIILVSALIVASSVLTLAQTNIPVVTAKAKNQSHPLDLGYLKKYNPRVAPKGNGTNRVVHTKGNNKGEAIRFPIDQKTPLLDGRFLKQGTIAAPTVRINYGAAREVKDKSGKKLKYLQVFNTKLEDGKSASGWVLRTALRTKIPKMPTVTAKRPPAGPKTDYTITGGNPLSPKFNRTNSSGQFVRLKVNPRYTGGGRNATDYLLRPTGVVNQAINLPGKGGVSFDAYRAGTTFKRSKAIHSVAVPLYLPGAPKPVTSMRLVYGSVQTPTGPRHGWMALDALKRKL